MIGGTQDNGTQRFNLPGLSNTDEPTGADGTYCFIDQDNPNIQITGSQNGWYLVTTADGESGWAYGRYLTPVDPAANLATDSAFWASD